MNRATIFRVMDIERGKKFSTAGKYEYNAYSWHYSVNIQWINVFNSKWSVGGLYLQKILKRNWWPSINITPEKFDIIELVTVNWSKLEIVLYTLFVLSCQTKLNGRTVPQWSNLWAVFVSVYPSAVTKRRGSLIHTK